ncbi:MAG: DUF4290 domain-containing protein [Bacteroidia bacterium]|nr:DUF4290 domain-containing protein [Bacteroidia bacterium]
MDYNSSREKLEMPEYGRHIQKMVDYALTIRDREERSMCAASIVNVMANMYPEMKNEPDFKHKLWDHLHAIAYYQLDVDSPYPKPTPEEVSPKPKPLSYPMHKVRLPHYGYLTEHFANRACSIENPQERKTLVNYIANHMKKTLIAMNKDYATDERLMKEILLLTDDRLEIDGEIRTAFYQEPKNNKNNKSNKPNNNKQKQSNSKKNNKPLNNNRGNNKNRKRF